MSVLITGGCGFVGINVAEELLGKGEHVVLLDRIGLPACATRLAREHESRLSVVSADVRDLAMLKAMFRASGVDRVIHTAVITAGEAREASEPNEIVDVNLRGTVNILEAAKSTGCNRVVYVGSGQAYGKTHAEGLPLREETSPSRPEEIYGITKFAAEQIALRLGTLWGMSVISVRLGSVCGPWEFDTGVRDMLSPHLKVAQLAARGETAVLPQKEVWRDWIYSRDVGAGLVAVLTARNPRHTLYHLSSGLDWQGSFAHWCDTLKRIYPQFSWRIAAGGEQPNVSYLLTRDRAPMEIGRLVNDIGFKPRFGPREAYNDYIEWIRGHQDFVTANAGAAIIE